MVNGIDVSKWQGSGTDFWQVKTAGIDFAIIRAGLGRLASQKDPCFEQNYKKAVAAGLKVGAYWYSYANSADDAVREAKACLEVIKGKKFDYPIYFDLENKWQFLLGKKFCSKLVEAFCSTLENAGYFAGLYMSRWYLQNYITPEVARRYAVWVADYNSKCKYNGAYGIWQYSSKGSIAGVKGDVDLDIAYIDYPKIIRREGLNGFKTVEQLANEVLNDEWGKGSERRKRLTEAGYNYEEVQARVNEIIKNR